MKRRSFTMIELVFIIVILGLLAAIAVPKLSGSRTDAKAVLIKQDIATITQALAALVMAQGGYVIENVPGQGLGTLGVNSEMIEFDHVGEINRAHWKSFFPYFGTSTRHYGQYIYSTLATDGTEANSADAACVTMRTEPFLNSGGHTTYKLVTTIKDSPVCRKIGIPGVVETPLEGARVKF